jgi:hypothetical protein
MLMMFVFDAVVVAAGAVLAPLCVVVLAWATSVFRKAVA